MEKNNKISDNKIETHEKIRILLNKNFNLRIKNKISRLKAEFYKSQYESIKYFLTIIITVLITVFGIQWFNKQEFTDFKKEVRGEIAKKPRLSLLGTNYKTLENQYIKVNKVFIVYRNNYGVKLSKPSYHYVINIMIKNEGEGAVKADSAISYMYGNVVEPEIETGDPDFNNLVEISIGTDNALTKVIPGKTIPYFFTTKTSDKPVAGTSIKVKYKIFYGEQEVSSIFFVKFSEKVKFEDFDTK
jgi:hypothetical protein